VRVNAMATGINAPRGTALRMFTFSNPNRRFNTIIAAAFALGVTAGGCATDDDDDEELIVAETQTVLDGIRAGDEVTAGGLAVTAPEVGERVAATLDFLDGTAATLLLETLDDGTVVRVEQDADPDAADLDAARAADPCRDDAFRLLGHKWRSV
jgi:hypothetical protein